MRGLVIEKREEKAVRGMNVSATSRLLTAKDKYGRLVKKVTETRNVALKREVTDTERDPEE